MRSVIKYFIQYPVWGYVLLALILGFGLVSLLGWDALHIDGVRKSFFPEREEHTIIVEVAYPGASPEEMEEGVTLKVEQALKGAEGIEEVTSVSRENSAAITVTLFPDYDADLILMDVKNAVDKINAFPEGAEKPVVYVKEELERSANLILKGKTDLLTLKTFADKIEYDLLSTDLITQVTIRGVPPLEFSVEIKEEALRRYGLRFQDLVAAIRENNVDISAGSIKTEQEEILIRSRNRSYSALEIGNIVVKTQSGGAVLRVRDVAEVRKQFADQPEQTYYNGERAVTIKIEKTPDQDLFEIIEYLRGYADEFNAQYAPLELLITNDRSIYIQQRINMLVSNGLIGLLLVLISLSLFLNWRLAFWVALAIPISFAGMFIVANLAGITINVLSLFGMILVIGILVDDGIVFGENIYTYSEEGAPRKVAALEGAMEVLPSVFASITTTIVAFLPFFFLEGRFGEAVDEMALVVIACLAFSLIEGALLLPEHLAHSKALDRNQKKGKVRAAIDNFFNYVRDKGYAWLLRRSARYPYVTLALALFFVMTVMGMVRGGFINTTFFPFVDSDEVNINLSLKPGMREQQTLETFRRIERVVWALNDSIKKTREDSADVVVSTRIDIDKVSPEKGELEVELLDGEARNISSSVMASAFQQAVGPVPEAEKLTYGGRRIFGKPVALSIRGLELEQIYGARDLAMNELNQYPALRDVTDTDELGKREIDIKLKPLAYALDLTTADIIGQLRSGYFGAEAQRLQIGKDEVKVWVRYPMADRENMGQLENVRIKTIAGSEYPLSDLVTYTMQRSIVAINHSEGVREIKVEADLQDPNTPVPPILDKIRNEVVPKVKSRFPGVDIKFEGQDKENAKFTRSITRAFPIAFCIMLVIIVLVFRSIPQMLVVLCLIPLGLFGAFLGHGIEGKHVSVLSVYGMVALIGIIVNDSVVFISKFNSVVRSGAKVRDAIFITGKARFRPILLTSITTVAGLYPLILEKSRQAQFLIPMAISVAWGMVFVTMFALLVLPAFLMIANDLRAGVVWLWTGKRPTKESVEPAAQEVKRQEED